MEPEAAPAPEVTQSLEHDVVIEEGEHTMYPAALASHETVLEDKQLFLGLLQDLCTKLQDAEPKKFRPTKFRIPTAAGQDLDLQRLYRCATQLGGAVSITEQHRWPDVIRPMNFPSKVNTAAIRKIYSQLLWHFEQVYFHNAAGQPILEPPELAAASAAAAAVQAAAADRQTPNSAAMANGTGRNRPARSRKGPSLAALIAAEDQISSGLEDGEGADDQEDSQPISDGAAGSEDEADDSAAAAAPASAATAPPGADGAQLPPAKKPEAVALLAAAAPAAAGSPGRSSAPPAAPGSSAAPAAGAGQPAKPRSRPQQQPRSSAAAPGKTPELTAFLKAGRHRRDLTGASVSGKVEARFDCGYFVSITVGGLQFGGVLYCPTGTATGGGQQASRAPVRREEGAAPGSDAGVGGSRKPPAGAGSGIKREAGAAGLEGGAAGGGGGSRAAKRRRSIRDVNDPTLANKPKSAKTAFNFFAAEQWANLRSELGSNAAPQDISRMIGERWNKTSEEERAPYIAKAAEDKGRFEREMGTWRSGLEAAAAAADSAGGPAADAEAEATAGASTSPAAGDAAEAMDVDTAAAAAPAPAAVAVKQEQQSATPPRPQQPRLKLKMSGGSRHTPPPAAPAAAEAPVAAAEAAAAAAPPAAAPATETAVGSEGGAAAEGQQQPIIDHAAAADAAAAAGLQAAVQSEAGAAAVHQSQPDAAEEQQQQQPPSVGFVAPESTTAVAVPPPPPPPPPASEAAAADADAGMAAAAGPVPAIVQDGMSLDAPDAQQ